MRKLHPDRRRDPELGARIGRKVRELRLAARMTQLDLAEGWCTKASVSAIESGKTMSLDALTRIADRLGVPLRTLLDDSAEVSMATRAPIRAVEIDRGRVVAELIDGRIVGLPLRLVDGLLDATLRDLEAWRLAPGRRVVEWPALGVSLGLDAFFGDGLVQVVAPAKPRGRPARRVQRAATD